VAERNGFPSRQRRWRTGRNRQLNIKATDETVNRMTRIFEDRRMSLGAVLELALEALEEKEARSGI
jgi:hypothetical protein